MTFEYPDDYLTLPVQRRAHLQFQRHVLRITRSEGYYNDVIECHLDKRDWENSQNFPVCNLVWGPEDILNAQDIDKSMGVYNARAHVFMEWLLEGENPSLERALIKADVEKYFLRPHFFTLPEHDDGEAPLVHQVMPVSITPYGDHESTPRCKLEIEWLVWYRTQMGNPVQKG